MSIFDLALETEEFITAEEYIRRKKSGKIDVRKTRYALDNRHPGVIGGFYVKLDKPRYRMGVPSVMEQRHAK